MPVVTVSNQTKSTVVLSFRDPSKDHIEWAPMGSPDGEDVQQVDSDMVQGQRFARAIGLGLLKLEDGDDALTAAVEKQAARFAARRQAEDKVAMENLLPSNQTGVIRLTEDQLEEHIKGVSKHGEGLEAQLASQING